MALAFASEDTATSQDAGCIGDKQATSPSQDAALVVTTWWWESSGKAVPAEENRHSDAIVQAVSEEHQPVLVSPSPEPSISVLVDEVAQDSPRSRKGRVGRAWKGVVQAARRAVGRCMPCMKPQTV